LEKNQKYIGQTVSVLVDDHHDGFCEGNNKEMKRVRILTNKNLVGQIIRVEIKEAKEWLLIGKLL